MGKTSKTKRNTTNKAGAWGARFSSWYCVCCTVWPRPRRWDPNVSKWRLHLIIWRWQPAQGWCLAHHNAQVTWYPECPFRNICPQCPFRNISRMPSLRIFSMPPRNTSSWQWSIISIIQPPVGGRWRGLLGDDQRLWGQDWVERERGENARSYWNSFE